MTHAAHAATGTLTPGGVVVGYDGSPDADRALPWAVEVAEGLGAPLQVLTAHDIDPSPLVPGGGRESWDVVAAGRLDRATECVEKHGGTVVETMALFVPPAQALIEVGRTARLAVLGARGHTRLGGMALGSVSQHVTRQAGCPVAVVREQAAPEAREVVVGVDAGPDADTALALAFELAQQRRAPLVALHGWSPVAGERVAGKLPPTGGVVDRVRHGEQLLHRATSTWRERYPDVAVMCEAMPVHPARLLADASHHASVVVVGSRGRGAFTGLLLGSVSQAVLSHAACPVVVAR